MVTGRLPAQPPLRRSFSPRPGGRARLWRFGRARGKAPKRRQTGELQACEASVYEVAKFCHQSNRCSSGGPKSTPDNMALSGVLLPGSVVWGEIWRRTAKRRAGKSLWPARSRSGHGIRFRHTSPRTGGGVAVTEYRAFGALGTCDYVS
jgi:hypothetical protein